MQQKDWIYQHATPMIELRKKERNWVNRKYLEEDLDCTDQLRAKRLECANLKEGLVPTAAPPLRLMHKFEQEKQEAIENAAQNERASKIREENARMGVFPPVRRPAFIIPEDVVYERPPNVPLNATVVDASGTVPAERTRFGFLKRIFHQSGGAGVAIGNAALLATIVVSAVIA